MKGTNLKVIEARKGEVFRDIIRLSEKWRIDQTNNIIKSGTICKVLVGENSTLVIVRGVSANDTRETDNVILVDDYLRDKEKLDVSVGKEYEFKFETHWWYRLIFGWKATDPGYRVGYQIALISFFLGIVSISPMVWQFIKWLYNILPCKA